MSWISPSFKRMVCDKLLGLDTSKASKKAFFEVTTLNQHGVANSQNNAATNAPTNAPTTLIGGLLSTLAGELNQTNAKQNDIATKYNDLATKYNDLATKFNSLLTWLENDRNITNAIRKAGAGDYTEIQLFIPLSKVKTTKCGV